jgi:hypothetical protein
LPTPNKAVSIKMIINENNNEPATPSHVFFGEIFGASLCVPKNTPKI